MPVAIPASSEKNILKAGQIFDFTRYLQRVRQIIPFVLLLGDLLIDFKPVLSHPIHYTTKLIEKLFFAALRLHGPVNNHKNINSTNLDG